MAAPDNQENYRRFMLQGGGTRDQYDAFLASLAGDTVGNGDQVVTAQPVGEAIPLTPPPMQATTPLESDPAYLAFKRALGDQYAAAESGANSDIEAHQRALRMRLAQITDQGNVDRRHVSDNYESRGFFGGGHMAQALARQRAAEGQQETGLQNETGDYISALRNSLLEKKADFDRQAAEKGLGAAPAIVTDEALTNQPGTTAPKPTTAAAVGSSDPSQNATGLADVPFVPTASLGPDSIDPAYLEELKKRYAAIKGAA